MNMNINHGAPKHLFTRSTHVYFNFHMWVYGDWFAFEDNLKGPFDDLFLSIQMLFLMTFKEKKKIPFVNPFIFMRFIC